MEALVSLLGEGTPLQGADWQVPGWGTGQAVTTGQTLREPCYLPTSQMGALSPGDTSPAFISHTWVAMNSRRPGGPLAQRGPGSRRG